MKITSNTYKTIQHHLELKVLPPETGGMLGCDISGIIHAVCFDEGCGASIEHLEYIPDTDSLNACINEWQQLGISFCGMFHTHQDVPGGEKLSGADRSYIERVMQAMPEGDTELFFPIVIPGKKFVPYKAVLTGAGVSIVVDTIEIITTR